MSIQLTEKAIDKIKEIIIQQDMIPENTRVRVSVHHLGDSSASYSFKLEEEFAVNSSSSEIADEIIVPDEEIFNVNGLKIIYDKKFAEALSHVVVDFREVEGNGGFVFNDPVTVAKDCKESCS